MKAFRYWFYLRRTNFPRWIRDVCMQFATTRYQLMMCVNKGMQMCYDALKIYSYRSEAVQACIDELRKFVEHIAQKGL